MIEKCIHCNKPTPYDINYPVERRKYYIDGSGQLCEECWNALFPAPSYSSTSFSPTAGEKKEQGEMKKNGLERLRAAREEKPLHRSDFSEAELEKLKGLAPEEYELLK